MADLGRTGVGHRLTNVAHTMSDGKGQKRQGGGGGDDGHKRKKHQYQSVSDVGVDAEGCAGWRARHVFSVACAASITAAWRAILLPMPTTP